MSDSPVTPARGALPAGRNIVMKTSRPQEPGETVIDPADIELPPTEPIDITPFLNLQPIRE